VVILRGHQINPWDLRPFEELKDRFQVVCLVTRSNVFDASSLGIEKLPTRAVRDLLPGGRTGDVAARALGDRYLRLSSKLAGADIVHTAELGSWVTRLPAELKAELGYKLVVTTWETIPHRNAYRRFRAREHRRLALRHVDLYLATTERARECLLLEGVAEESIEVCAPGVDERRFAAEASTPAPSEHTILSVGRLVWEKGHQDVLRALAALEHGIVPRPGEDAVPARLRVVGVGPEERRLRRYAEDLGVSHLVDFSGGTSYERMPTVYRSSTCLVLASLPTVTWEEQFGMVLVEAMIAGLPIIAAASGAIPEVVGERGTFFEPGDWIGLARALAAGPLAEPPGTTHAADEARIVAYSAPAAARRLAAAYERVLAAT
jgi:glycosyltransferase involved in cell wall biosynthesis